jgi:heme/copper-type cytochrome/quinol oxidase subunit 2
MTSAATYTPNLPANAGWLTRAEAWLDHKGKGAWIAAMVLGFIFFWPVGLALLAYMIWSKRMFSNSCRSSDRHSHHHTRKSAWAAVKPSGNSAFDAYKAETLRRLQDEQDAFDAFLERLREAKDKSEFDQFMEDRAKKATEQASESEDA